MDFLLGQVFGLVLGVVASFLFWFVMLKLRPQVKPTPFIAYSKKDNRFQFKIFNNTRRQILDISVSLRLVERLSTPSTKNPNLGKIKTVHRFTLTRDNHFALASKQVAWGLPFIITVNTHTNDRFCSDLDKLFTATDGGERRLVVTIGSTDSLSSTRNIQLFTYTRSDVKYGSFDRELTLVEEPIVDPDFLDAKTNEME